MALNKISSDRDAFHGVLGGEGKKRTLMTVNQNNMSVVTNLLTNLYERPISAMVREVMSNAVDAYGEGEVPTIEVSLPTEFNPVFSVRDHGVGMSPDTLENVYAQYSNSTKEDDFTKIGAYGLGAKSPLAYCDAFFVETTQDGVTTLAEIVREDGELALYHSSKKTGKANGTLVSIPIKEDDLNSVKYEFNTYKDLPFDANLIIDGEKHVNNKWIVLSDDFVLDHDTNTVGRVWVRKSTNAIARLQKLTPYSPLGVRYVLSGFGYKAYGTAPLEFYVCVELKVGVVEFNSARDAITSTEIIQKIDSRVRQEVLINTQKKFDNVILGMGKMTYSDVKNILLAGKLINGYNSHTKTNLAGINLGNKPIIGHTIATDEDGKAREVKTDFSEILSGHEAPEIYFGIVDCGRSIYFTDGIEFNVNKLASGVVNAYKGGLARVESGNPETFLVDALISAKLHNRQVGLVTGVTVEKMKELRPLLSLVMKNTSADLLLFTPRNDLGEELERVSPLFEDTSRTVTVDGLISFGKELAEKASKRKEIIGVYKFSSNLTVTELYHLNHSVHKRSVELGELNKDDTVLIFANSSYEAKQVLTGAANEGRDVYNKRIFYINKMNAGAHLLLKDHPCMLFSKSFRHRSQKVNELAEAMRVESASLLENAELAFTDKDFARTIISRLGINFTAIYEKWIKDSAYSHELGDISNLLAETLNHADSEVLPIHTFSLGFLTNSASHKLRRVAALIAIARNQRNSTHSGVDTFSVSMISRYINLVDKDRKLTSLDNEILNELSAILVNVE